MRNPQMDIPVTVTTVRPRSSLPFSFNEHWSGWGWSVLFGQLAIIFGFLIFGIFGLTHFAFASRQLGDYTYFQQQNVQKSTRFEVQGDLSWKDGVARVADYRTGTVYKLSNSDQVKSLYDQGVRKIAVSGTLAGADTASATIDVETLAAIH